MRVLLLGGGLQALSFGESLYMRKDYEVSVVSNGYDVRKSKFFDKVYKIETDNFDDILNGIFSNEQYDVIVPMVDDTVSYLSDNKEKIEYKYHVKCAVGSRDLISIVSDKSNFMDFCKRNGFPHPKTQSLSQSTIEIVANQIGFPSLIKPDYSIGARGITRVDSLDELKKVFPVVNSMYGSCTLQEYIDNPDYYFNVMMYRDLQGNSDNSVVIKILRKYPIAAGSSSCCISVENQELLSLCKQVLDSLGWIGMADFDVLQRKDTKEYKIIEINPRVPASLRAAYVSGVNFPEMIVSEIMGETIKKCNYCPGKTLRYLGIDIMWLIKSSNRLKTTPSWFQFVGKDIYYQDIMGTDPTTWYSWLVTGVSKLFCPHTTVH